MTELLRHPVQNIFIVFALSKKLVLQTDGTDESKGGGGINPPPFPVPCGTEKSVVLRGLRENHQEIVAIQSKNVNRGTYFLILVQG